MAKLIDLGSVKGSGISSIAKTATVGLVDTYTITYDNGSTSTFNITNGQAGDKAYLHIKWGTSATPETLLDTPDAYIGLCASNNPTPPSNYSGYSWYQYKGDKGDQGNPGVYYGTTEPDHTLYPVWVDSDASSLMKVIDNLTTGGATDALSAGQGKVLKELVDTKADVTQEAWITPTLINGWTEYNAGFPVGYYKDQFNVVHLRGMLSTGTTNTAAFTLPVGYRPSTNKYFIVAQNAANAIRGYLQTTGGLRPCTEAYNAWVSLDNVSFRAEA